MIEITPRKDSVKDKVRTLHGISFDPNHLYPIKVNIKVWFGCILKIEDGPIRPSFGLGVKFIVKSHRFSASAPLTALF